MIRQRDIYQNELANKLYSLGDTLITEKGNVKGLQKKSKKTEKSDSTVVTKSGKEVLKNKKKKRFGSSIKSNAPATFVQKLKKKQELNDRIFHEVDSKVNKASQYHHDTGEYVKSGLNERSKTVDDQLVQRGMYSAFLLRNTDLDTDLINPEKCMGDFDSFIDNQSEAIKELSNKHISKELMAIIGKEVLDIKNKIY